MINSCGRHLVFVFLTVLPGPPVSLVWFDQMISGHGSIRLHTHYGVAIVPGPSYIRDKETSYPRHLVFKFLTTHPGPPCEPGLV